MENSPTDSRPVRPAEPAELDRMTGCVRWMYERGQEVVLWVRTGQISLVPDSLPAVEVLILRRGG